MDEIEDILNNEIYFTGRLGSSFVSVRKFQYSGEIGY
jgi:hypothetical protein